MKKKVVEEVIEEPVVPGPPEDVWSVVWKSERVSYYRSDRGLKVSYYTELAESADWILARLKTKNNQPVSPDYSLIESIAVVYRLINGRWFEYELVPEVPASMKPKL